MKFKTKANESQLTHCELLITLLKTVVFYFFTSVCKSNTMIILPGKPLSAHSCPLQLASV